MDNFDFIDSENRFLRPNFNNSTVTGINSVISKLDLLATPKFQPPGNKLIDELWSEHGKQDKVQNIVLIIADSLGTYNIHETGVLQSYIEKNLEMDTSFPTMTSTNMASLSYAQYPSTHGLVGYNIYHEKLNGIFNSLNCKAISHGKEVSVEKLHLNKNDIIAGENVFSIVNRQANLCMQDLYYEIWTPDMFSMQGLPYYLFGPTAPTFTYNSYAPNKMLQELYHHLFNSRSLNIICIYFPHTDMTSHMYTAQSKEYYGSMKLLESVINALERHPTVAMGETAVIVTSDHGQCKLPTGDQRINVSAADVKEHNNKGFSIGTSGRTLHVYFSTESGQRNAEDYLEKYFGNGKNGVILDQQEAMGLLGPNAPSEQYSNRLGQKVVLVDENFYLDYPEVVHYGDEKELVAQHGGLSRKELKVPFLII